MAKILEVESSVEKDEQPKANDKVDGFKNLIEGTMKKSYVMGLSNGARAMCVSILAEIKKNEKRSFKKQVDAIRQMCLKNMQKGKQPKENANEENDNKGD